MRVSKPVVYLSLLIIAVFVGVSYATLINFPETVKNTLKKKVVEDFSAQVDPVKVTTPHEAKKISYSFALISDVHNNTDGLRETVRGINNTNVDFVIGVGDYSNIGTEGELKKIKVELDKLEKPFYVLPGDHDLWNGRDKKNEPKYYFNKIFGDQKKSLSHKGSLIVLLDNADLYYGVEQKELEGALEEINKTKESTVIIISHKAIYHPLTIHRMGYIQEDKVATPYNQALMITDKLTKLIDKKIHLVHGDLHSSSSFKGPSDNILNHTIGALSKEKNFQGPRYAIGDIFEDGSLKIKDITVK